MAAPRSRSDPLMDDAESDLSPALAVAPVAPLPAPPTIQDVLDLMAAYLVTHYADSLTDQEAVHDAARMLDDGHLIPAWRHLSRMIEGVLNVPPGG